LTAGAYSDADLYRRGAATLLASWAEYARGSAGAAIVRRPGVAAGVFPHDPERAVYNNALIDRGLGPSERGAALAALEDAYASAGIARFAVWVHDTDAGLRAEVERRGYRFDTSTRAMGMTLGAAPGPRPELELADLAWPDYLRRFGMPEGLLAGGDLSAFLIVSAQLGGTSVSTATAFDHDGDCGIYNVGTLERARRRGTATALTSWHLRAALERGCRTASVQSTPMAEGVYAAAGFRDLGRFLEYVPAC